MHSALHVNRRIKHAGVEPTVAAADFVLTRSVHLTKKFLLDGFKAVATGQSRSC